MSSSTPGPTTPVTGRRYPLKAQIIAPSRGWLQQLIERLQDFGDANLEAVAEVGAEGSQVQVDIGPRRDPHATPACRPDARGRGGLLREPATHVHGDVGAFLQPLTHDPRGAPVEGRGESTQARDGSPRKRSRPRLGRAVRRWPIPFEERTRLFGRLGYRRSSADAGASRSFPCVAPQPPPRVAACRWDSNPFPEARPRNRTPRAPSLFFHRRPQDAGCVGLAVTSASSRSQSLAIRTGHRAVADDLGRNPPRTRRVVDVSLPNRWRITDQVPRDAIEFTEPVIIDPRGRARGVPGIPKEDFPPVHGREVQEEAAADKPEASRLFAGIEAELIGVGGSRPAELPGPPSHKEAVAWNRPGIEREPIPSDERRRLLGVDEGPSTRSRRPDLRNRVVDPEALGEPAEVVGEADPEAARDSLVTCHRGEQEGEVPAASDDSSRRRTGFDERPCVQFEEALEHPVDVAGVDFAKSVSRDPSTPKLGAAIVDDESLNYATQTPEILGEFVVQTNELAGRTERTLGAEEREVGRGTGPGRGRILHEKPRFGESWCGLQRSPEPSPPLICNVWFCKDSNLRARFELRTPLRDPSTGLPKRPRQNRLRQSP